MMAVLRSIEILIVQVEPWKTTIRNCEYQSSSLSLVGFHLNQLILHLQMFDAHSQVIESNAASPRELWTSKCGAEDPPRPFPIPSTLPKPAPIRDEKDKSKILWLCEWR
jgi:hypothetical protein